MFHISLDAACNMQHGDLIWNLPYRYIYLSYTWLNQLGKDLFTSQLLCCRGDVLCQGGFIIPIGSCQEWPHLCLSMTERETTRSHAVLARASSSYQGGDNKKGLRRGPQKRGPLQCIVVCWQSSVKALKNSKGKLCFFVQGSVRQAKQLKLSV